jgi:hypothetical protein
MVGLSTGLMRYVGQPDFVAEPRRPHDGLNSAERVPAGVPRGARQRPAVVLGLQRHVPDRQQLQRQRRAPPDDARAHEREGLLVRLPVLLVGVLGVGLPELQRLLPRAPHVAAQASLPADKNVSFDGLGNALSVNNGFFDVCQPAGCFTCPKGVQELDCTGMENGKGGATAWLTTDAPIVPGETIVLELMVFDVQDQFFDSHALIDNFRWQLEATLGTHE